ncbi:4'-phosphopantetheinyl transferase [Paraburkholderia sp. BL8N3]|nr:4'-phosphopantetheinyl transferase superfamily protein [Paraburkholderia sp. BL8N3]TCK33790.1 4'-phosphopantetheinyl transferase [Paraburkholderia sp. BL8N3]
MQNFRKALNLFPASLYGTYGGKRQLFAQAVLNLNNTIDLWFVDAETIGDRAFQQDAEAILSQDERARRDRFRFPKLRRDFLITRWLVRNILSERLSVPARDLRFGTNAYGRPFLVAYPELSFNISHTDGLIALAVAQTGEIGMDVERLQTGRATSALADYSFAASERAALNAIAAEEFDEAFLTYWTLKESYIKALGTGLSTPLDSFSFSVEDEKSIGFKPPVQIADGSPPHFWLLRPRRTHLCAVCVRHASPPFTLTACNVTPLNSKSAFDVTVLRCSTD